MRQKARRDLKLLFVISLIASLLGFSENEADALVDDDVFNIVTLTDSYGAGIGMNPNYETTLVSTGKSCRQAAKNQTRMVGEALRNKGWQVLIDNRAACMGFKIPQLNDHLNTQTGRDAVANADLVFVRIGGNDAGFVPRLTCTALTNLRACLKDGPLGKREISNLLKQELEIFVRKIASRGKPGQLIVLDGYPDLFGDGLNDWDYTNAGCGAAALKGVLSISELREIRQLTASLNQGIKAAANNVNGHNGVTVRFMGVQDLYEGHGICGVGTDWINLFAAYPNLFHPNATAYRAEANRLELLVGQHFNKSDFDGKGGGNTDPTYPPIPDVPTNSRGYSDAPFACGVTAPYASTYDTYGNYDHGNAIDFPLPNGTLVVSPVAGRVAVKHDVNGYGRYVDITEPNGTLHRFAHLQLEGLAPNGDYVNRGDVLGRVGTTGATTGPHLHYEKRQNNQQVAIQLDGAPFTWGSRFTSGGDRRTTHGVTSTNCFDAEATKQLRVGALGVGGCLFVKETKLDGRWTKQLCDVKAFLLEKDRIAVLTKSGALHVKEGALSAAWKWQASNVVDFDLENDRIAIVNNKAKSYVKQGGLTAQWVKVHGGTKDIELEGNRIGVLQTNNYLHVKSPNINSGWKLMSKYVHAFVLEDDRIVIDSTGSKVRAKEGALSAPWKTMFTGDPTTMLAVGDRIALEFNGSLWVKDGALSATWVQLGSGSINTFAMTDSRFMVSHTWNRLQIKETQLDSTWKTLMDANVVQSELSGNLIGFVSSKGVFFAKAPRVNSQWHRMLNGVESIQIEVY